MNMRFNTLVMPFMVRVSRLGTFLRGNNGSELSGANQKQSTRGGVGEVFIVGAGPGDAELLTLKAYRLLQEADVVLFDWLVDQSVLDCIPRHVAREFVGKRCGKHSVPQDKICERLVELGLQGKRVVRLKAAIRLYLPVPAKKPMPCIRRVFRLPLCQVLPQHRAHRPIPEFR